MTPRNTRQEKLRGARMESLRSPDLSVGGLLKIAVGICPEINGKLLKGLGMELCQVL